jgi:hypothetical protein
MFEVEVRNVAALLELAQQVDRIAEIPNSLRNGTAVRMSSVRATGTG